jgi:hypothetical protein
MENAQDTMKHEKLDVELLHMWLHPLAYPPQDREM